MCFLYTTHWPQIWHIESSFQIAMRYLHCFCKYHMCFTTRYQHSSGGGLWSEQVWTCLQWWLTSLLTSSRVWGQGIGGLTSHALGGVCGQGWDHVWSWGAMFRVTGQGKRGAYSEVQWHPMDNGHLRTLRPPPPHWTDIHIWNITLARNFVGGQWILQVPSECKTYWHLRWRYNLEHSVCLVPEPVQSWWYW